MSRVVGSILLDKGMIRIMPWWLVNPCQCDIPGHADGMVPRPSAKFGKKKPLIRKPSDLCSVLFRGNGSTPASNWSPAGRLEKKCNHAISHCKKQKPTWGCSEIKHSTDRGFATKTHNLGSKWVPSSWIQIPWHSQSPGAENGGSTFTSCWLRAWCKHCQTSSWCFPKCG